MHNNKVENEIKFKTSFLIGALTGYDLSTNKKP